MDTWMDGHINVVVAGKTVYERNISVAGNDDLKVSDSLKMII